MPAVSPGTTNLQAWWELNETSGTRVDAHTNGLDLTEVNSVTSDTGIQGNAAEFVEANSERLYVASDAAIAFGDEDFSVCGWFKSSSSGTEGLLGKWNAGTNSREYMLRIETSGALRWFVSPNGTSNTNITHSTTGLQDGSWHFFIVYHDSVNNLIGVSVDGGAFQTKAYSSGVDDGTQEFHIGYQGPTNGQYLGGLMDEVAIFSEVLSDDNRDWLYNSGSGRSYSDISGGGGASEFPFALYYGGLV